jgi:hypothetical protein
MKDHPYVQHFIRLVEYWNAAGWGEYLAFETLNGQRDRPFPLLDPLPAADLDVLRRMRDELKVWAYWDETANNWEVVSINVWRQHVKTTSADSVRDALHARTV